VSSEKVITPHCTAQNRCDNFGASESACSPVERLGLTSKQLTCITSVGVQVRIANTATGEYIPGSTDPLSPEGKYAHTVNLPLFGDSRSAFDQSAVGKATLKATQYAVLKAIQRFDRAGW
jgi:hypothetical protein